MHYICVQMDNTSEIAVITVRIGTLFSRISTSAVYFWLHCSMLAQNLICKVSIFTVNIAFKYIQYLNIAYPLNVKLRALTDNKILLKRGIMKR